MWVSIMQDKENVTIVICSHNNAKTIKRALESVTKGIRPANQITIADNDSSDGTYELLCNLLNAEQVTIDGKTGWPPEFDGKINDIPIKILKKRFSTTGHSLNIAMQMKWQGVTIFGFMDPTSWYEPDKIAQSIRAFNINPSIACVVSDCDNHYSDGRVERVFRSSFDMNRLLCTYPYDNNLLVRSIVFQKLKSGFNEQISSREDYDLLMKISEIGLIYHIPAPLHNNVTNEIDDTTQQLLLQSEEIVRQLTAQRRGQTNDS
jgi:glycosyltransferase involved in cell wall biosynthesis